MYMCSANFILDHFFLILTKFMKIHYQERSARTELFQSFSSRLHPIVRSTWTSRAPEPNWDGEGCASVHPLPLLSPSNTVKAEQQLVRYRIETIRLSERDPAHYTRDDQARTHGTTTPARMQNRQNISCRQVVQGKSCNQEHRPVVRELPGLPRKVVRCMVSRSLISLISSSLSIPGKAVPLTSYGHECFRQGR